MHVISHEITSGKHANKINQSFIVETLSKYLYSSLDVLKSLLHKVNYTSVYKPSFIY